MEKGRKNSSFLSRKCDNLSENGQTDLNFIILLDSPIYIFRTLAFIPCHVILSSCPRNNIYFSNNSIIQDQLAQESEMRRHFHMSFWTLGILFFVFSFFPSTSSFLNLFFNWRKIVHGVVLVSAVQQCDQPQLYMYPFPSFHPSRSSQNARFGSLGYVATSHQLSILHMVLNRLCI